MYFVTVLKLDTELWDKERKSGEDLYKRIRCWGYYDKEGTARRAVLENWTDIYEEAYYNLAVIEKLASGIPATHGEETWFSVTPVIDPEAVKWQEEKEKAWEDADFFGNRLGKYLHRALVRRGFDVDANWEGATHEVTKYVPNITGSQLFRIENAKAPPEFTVEQQTSLITFLRLTPSELLEFLALQKKALEDTKHYGVPESYLKYATGSWGFADKDGVMQRGGHWTISGYEVVEIEKPLRFNHICGWSLA